MDRLSKSKTCKDKGGESYPDILEKVKEVLGRWPTLTRGGIKMSFVLGLNIIFFLMFSVFVIFDARDGFDRTVGIVLLLLYIILALLLFTI